MSSLFSSLTSGSFDKLLDKATSQVNLDPDWETILQICDSIRQRDITAKNAVTAIKKRIHDSNPRVAYFALVVLEACVKNCGSPIHDEIASKSFLDDIRSHVKIAPEKVKDKILELVQSWSKAFANSSSYTSFQDTYNIMKMEGYNFPPVKETDIMFTSEKAPEWIDGEECHMCHVNFGLIQRKHHCRKCGQIFCGQCSSKTSTIPQYGIEREERVCDHCYNQLKSKTTDPTDQTSSVPQSSDDLPAEYLNSALFKESQTPAQPRNDTDLRLQEEDDLQLALAMSLNEIDNKNHLQASSSMTSSSQAAPIPKNSPDTSADKSVSSASAPTVTEPEELDPELARYLDRSYWESRKEENEAKATESKSKNATSTKSSAGNLTAVKNTIEENSVSVTQEVKVQSSNPESEVDEDMVFLQTFTSSLQLFKERMEKASAEGRSIVIDASIQSLFQSLTAMHPQLLKISDETDLWKAEYESIMLKLKKVEDARTHLGERRTQYQESLREQERRQMEFRRIQMEEKLALRRRQKEQYLRYQREMEAERQRAEEQQRLQQLQFSQQMHNQYMNRFQTAFNQNHAASGNITNQGYNPAAGFVPQPQMQQQPAAQQALESNQQYNTNNIEGGYNQNRQPSQSYIAPDAAMNQNAGMPNNGSMHQPSSQQILMDSSQNYGYSDPTFNQNRQQVSFNSTDNVSNQPSTSSSGNISHQPPTQSLPQQFSPQSTQNFSSGSLYQNQSQPSYQSGLIGSPSQSGPQAQQNSVPPNPNQSPQFASQQPPQNPQQQFPPSNVMQVPSQQNYGNMLSQNIEQSSLPMGYGPQSAQGMQYAHPQQNVSQTSEMQPLIVFD